MISLEKWMMLTHLQKLPKNVGDLGKLIVAKGFEWLPKVQYIAQSGHTDRLPPLFFRLFKHKYNFNHVPSPGIWTHDPLNKSLLPQPQVTKGASILNP